MASKQDTLVLASAETRRATLCMEQALHHYRTGYRDTAEGDVAFALRQMEKALARLRAKFAVKKAR